MRISLFCENNSPGYSGGRYHAWMMAEALALDGHAVEFITNAKPTFYNDFSETPGHPLIRLRADNLFRPYSSPADIVILAPSLGRRPEVFYQAVLHAKMHDAALVLLNFETPNWFNAMSPVKRRPDLWKWAAWAASEADLILSSTKISSQFAQEFYSANTTAAAHDFCHPSINSYAADAIGDVARERRVLFIGRFLWGEHKGAGALQETLCEPLRGHTLSILVGMGEIPRDVMQRLRAKADALDIRIEAAKSLSDEEKFREIKRSRLLLFPSFFEGFGLPPVEALYCGTPCAAFDLPVLREVCGDRLRYAPAGDWPAFRNVIGNLMEAPPAADQLKAGIEKTARIGDFARRMRRILGEVHERHAESRSGEREASLQRIRACIRKHRLFRKPLYDFQDWSIRITKAALPAGMSQRAQDLWLRGGFGSHAKKRQ